MKFRYLFLMFLPLFGCQSESGDTTTTKVTNTKSSVDNEIDSVYTNMMKIHDDAMMLMDPIAMYLDSLNAVTDAEDSTVVNQLKHDLEFAEQRMMQWMRNHVKRDGMTADSFYTAVKQHALVMDSVDVEMRESIENAKLYFDEK